MNSRVVSGALVLLLGGALPALSAQPVSPPGAEQSDSRAMLARLDELLPRFVPERVKLPELLFELSDDQRGPGAPARWQRLRWSGQRRPSEVARREEAERILQALSQRADLPPGSLSVARVRFAEALWSLGEVEAAGAAWAESGALETASPIAGAFEPRIARARWLRRIGAHVEALAALELTESEGVTGELERSLVEEERGAVLFQRGAWGEAELLFATALSRRRQVVSETSDLRGLALRLAVAGVACRAERLRDQETAAAATTSAPNPDLELYERLAEVVALSPPLSGERENDLDRAWALAISSSLERAGWEQERRASLLAAGGALAEARPAAAAGSAGAEPALAAAQEDARWWARARARHIGAWSLELYPFAEALYEDTLKSFGDDHAESLALAEARRDRAQSLARRGALEDAQALLRASAEATARQLGSRHLESVLASAELAQIEWRTSGELLAVEAVAAKTVAALESMLGRSTVSLGLGILDLAAVRAELGEFRAAADDARRARAVLLQELAPTSPVLASAILELAWVFREVGALDEVESTLREIPRESSVLSCRTLDRTLGFLIAERRLRSGDIEAARTLVRAEVRRCASHELLSANLRPLDEMLSTGYRPRRGPRDAVGLDDLAHRGEKRIAAARRLGFAALVSLPIAALAFSGNENLSWDSAGGSSEEMAALSSTARDLGSVGARAAREIRRPGYQLLPVLDPNRECDFYAITGELLRASELYREGAALVRGALAGLERGVARTHPCRVALERDLAEALWSASAAGAGADFATDEREAREIAGRSALTLDEFLRDGVAALPEAQALRLVASRPRPEEILVSGALFGRSDTSAWRRAAWEWTLRRRSLVLDELASRRRRAAEIDEPAVAGAWSEFVAARRRLAALWVRGPETGPSYWQELEQAGRRRDEAEKELTKASAAYRERGNLRSASLEEHAAALPPASALVEYLRVGVRHPGERATTNHYVALTLDADGGTGAIDLGAAEPIDDLVGAWIEALRSDYHQLASDAAATMSSAEGQALRHRVWDPVAERLGAVDHVFLVLDGALNQVHFAALPDRTGRFLIESGPEIHLLTTGRQLLRFQSSERRDFGRGLLALGDPDFASSPNTEAGTPGAFRGPTPGCVSVGRLAWEALPASRLEVEAVAALYPAPSRAEVSVGEEATEHRLKRHAAGKSMLHLATHGFFLGDGCTAAPFAGRGIGGLAVSSDPTLESAARESETENPLLLSGLVLAGANNGAARPGEGEDGIVTAEELATLDLAGVETVALSACDTGLGTVANGEGVFGLRRALEIAGARTVLMSLWPVPDDAAREWMTRFYAHLFSGTPVAAATRAATLDCLARVRAGDQGRAHPFLWAGFVAGGDWR